MQYTVALYPWSHNVNWCLAEGYGNREVEISAALWFLWLITFLI